MHELHQAGREAQPRVDASRVATQARRCRRGAFRLRARSRLLRLRASPRFFAAALGRRLAPSAAALARASLRAAADAGALMSSLTASAARRRAPQAAARRSACGRRASTAPARRGPRTPAPACPTFRPPFAASPLPSPSRRRAPRPPCRPRPASCRSSSCLALLHQGLEQLVPSCLRLRERAEPGEPDLMRRIEHALRHVLRRVLRGVARRVRFARRELRFRFLQHRAFSSRAAPRRAGCQSPF